MKKDNEPLVSLRRPGSAEQAQFFSVFRSNGGKREASARGGMKKKKKKKAMKKHPYSYVHQDRKTTKNILRIVNS